MVVPEWEQDRVQDLAAQIYNCLHGVWEAEGHDHG